MARYPRMMPILPRMFAASVARTERVSPSFQRVTIAGADLADFEWLGHDHWFRLFLPATGAPLRLPEVTGRVWWNSYLAIPEAERPHCSNYTVAGYRRTASGGELDIDVVLHWHDGELSGAVAIWAAHAELGNEVGLLDQGLLFDPPADAAEYVLVADETGLPAVRGILRSLPTDATGVALLEVPKSGDVEQLAAPSGVQVRWLPRDGRAGTPGQLALAALSEVSPRPDAYAFSVGESDLATGGRRALHRAGLAKSRITFSGFWKA